MVSQARCPQIVAENFSQRYEHAARVEAGVVAASFHEGHHEGVQPDERDWDHIAEILGGGRADDVHQAALSAGTPPHILYYTD